ncbi:MAG: hypothetical protein ABSA53_31530 [Streptosporangiaceae bacterium]
MNHHDQPSAHQPPAPAGPPAARQPAHPVHALTTYELNGYRRELEHAIKGIAADAPVQADLRAKLDEVLAEQDDRARLTGRA